MERAMEAGPEGALKRTTTLGRAATGSGAAQANDKIRILQWRRGGTRISSILAQIRASRCQQCDSAGQRKRPACESSRSHLLLSANPRPVPADCCRPAAGNSKVDWQRALFICPLPPTPVQDARHTASASRLPWAVTSKARTRHLASSVQCTLPAT